MTPPVIQPPLGVASNTLPSLSITAMSEARVGTGPVERRLGRRGAAGNPEGPLADVAVEGQRIAAIWTVDARAMSIVDARDFA